MCGDKTELGQLLNNMSAIDIQQAVYLMSLVLPDDWFLTILSNNPKLEKAWQEFN